MHTWVLAFLLLALPFQLVWASAAQFCAHETSSSAPKDFGHHEHRHQASADKPALDDNAGGLGAYHADCEGCHLGCSASVPSPTKVNAAPALNVLPVASVPSYNSHVPSGPERPDRSDFASAARFGGDVVFGLQSA